jgi:hypothetical protein
MACLACTVSVIKGIYVLHLLLYASIANARPHETSIVIQHDYTSPATIVRQLT